MKSVISIVLFLGSISAHAVSGPAYQNLAIMNEIVQTLAKAEDSSLSSSDLVEAADEVELAKLVLEADSTFSVLSFDKYCTGAIKMEASNGPVGGNPEYSVVNLKCESSALGQKTIQWSTIESKIVKRAKTGKVTKAFEVNPANRRLKLK